MHKKVWSFDPSDVGPGFANVVALVSYGTAFGEWSSLPTERHIYDISS